MVIVVSITAVIILVPAKIIMVVISVVTMMLLVTRNILPVGPLTRYKEDPLATGVIITAVSGLFKTSDSVVILPEKRRADVTPHASTAETV
jgi:hypothetical protein